VEINEMWTYTHESPILSLDIGNINENEEIELIATTKNGDLLIFSLEGTLIHREIISENQPIWHSKLFDMDGNGNNKIILGGLDGYIRLFKWTSSNKLKKIWTHQFTSSISGIILEDINNNGQKEIIAYSLDKTLRILNSSDGNLIWGQIFEDGIGDAVILSNQKDLNQKEIIACGNDGTVRSFNLKNGELQWFKRYSNKMRCISTLSLMDGFIIAVGGDDKILHFIRSQDLKEVKSIAFDDYVWKLQSFSINGNYKLVISTYSFDYLNDTTSLESFMFTSKLICIDTYMDILWEINGINVESLDIFEYEKIIYILVGTTKGMILLVDGLSGKIIIEIKKNSCSNMVKYFRERQIVISCHDDGSLSSFKVNYL